VGIRKDDSSMKIMAGSAALGGMSSVSYLPSGGRSWKFALAFSTCIIPLKRHYGKAPAGFSADAVRSSTALR
jgi:hypothetical protein